MNAYVIAIIPLLTVPFLLYCLWNFARELKHMKSKDVSFFGASRSKFRHVTPLYESSTRPRIVALPAERRTAS